MKTHDFCNVLFEKPLKSDRLNGRSEQTRVVALNVSGCMIQACIKLVNVDLGVTQ